MRRQVPPYLDRQPGKCMLLIPVKIDTHTTLYITMSSEGTFSMLMTLSFHSNSVLEICSGYSFRSVFCILFSFFFFSHISLEEYLYMTGIRRATISDRRDSHDLEAWKPLINSEFVQPTNMKCTLYYAAGRRQAVKYHSVPCIKHSVSLVHQSSLIY